MRITFVQKKGLTKRKTPISKMMIYILICYCILFPADRTNIKEILLLITLATCYLRADRLIIQKNIFLYGIVWPILLIMYALMRKVSVGNAMSYGYVWIFILILPEIWRKKIDIKAPFMLATYIVALVIDFIMLSDMFGLISIFSNPVAVFFINMNEIPQVGKGALATFGYSIFYKSCPLILVTHGYFIYRKKYLLCLPLMIALLGSGTRANFLMALFITVAIPILCAEKQSRKMIVVLIIIVVSIYIAPMIIEKMIVLNTLKYNRSDGIKMLDMKVVMSLLKKNISNLLLGMGVGSSFLSPRGVEMTTFELSYIDLLRQSGIIGVGVFFSFIIKPMKKLWKEKRWLLICFIAYLAVAFTNPLLITSTSFMLYLLIYSEIQNKDMG